MRLIFYMDSILMKGIITLVNRIASPPLSPQVEVANNVNDSLYQALHFLHRIGEHPQGGLDGIGLFHIHPGVA